MISTLWAILGVIMFVAQFASGVFDLLFVAVAAMLVALGAALIPGFGDAIWLQVLTWVGTSFLSVFFFRKRFRHLFRGEELLTDKSHDSGQKAKVIEAITPEQPGRISFRGVSWTALSIDENIPVGAEVYILEVDGMNYTVSSRLLEDETAPASLPPETGPDRPDGPKQ